MGLNDVTYAIRGAAFKVYKNWGPGLLESIYERALLYELQVAGLQVEQQLGIPVEYDGIELGIGFRLDLLVEQQVIVEIKSVERLCDLHFKQLLSYLRLTKRQLGLLINFNAAQLDEREGIKRVVNGFVP